MTVHNIETDDEYKEIISKHEIVLIDFFATWCAPCKAIAPHIAELSNDEKYKGIHFTKVDVDNLSKLSDDLGVKSMPTLLLFKDGKKLDTNLEPSPQNLPEFLQKAL